MQTNRVQSLRNIKQSFSFVLTLDFLTLNSFLIWHVFAIKSYETVGVQCGSSFNIFCPSVQPLSILPSQRPFQDAFNGKRIWFRSPFFLLPTDSLTNLPPRASPDHSMIKTALNEQEKMSNLKSGECFSTRQKFSISDVRAGTRLGKTSRSSAAQLIFDVSS